MPAVKRKTKTKAARPKAKTKKEAQEALSAALARAVKARGIAPLAAAAQPTRMVVTVEVDANHLVPYSVRWDGDKKVLDQLQSGQAEIMIVPGRHLLTFSFNHTLETTWRHKLTVQIDGQAARVLADKNSTDNPKDAVSGGTEIFVA